jgi:hypothetical protein
MLTRQERYRHEDEGFKGAEKKVIKVMVSEGGEESSVDDRQACNKTKG